MSLAADVVHRAFPAETILLNLATGTYHGLNSTASRMLAQLESAPILAAAVAPLSAEFRQPVDVIERDLCELCEALRDRGLLDIAAA